MTIYLLEDKALPKVELLLVMRRCGSYLEPPHLIGLASITGQVMRTGGTANMSGDQMDEELEGIGASIESNLGTVTGTVGANVLTDYTEKIISLAADVVRRPIFDEDKIELAKTQERTAVSRRNDEPNYIADREFQKLIYGPESPYARHTEYATIDAITRDDIIMFHKTTVKPENIQLAVWGDFDKTDMQNLIIKYFGDWPRSETDNPAPPEVNYVFKPSVNYIEKSDLNQSTVYMGHLGSKMGDPDYPAITIMSEILGGDFGSRITDNVRTRMGLAYSAFGFYTFYYNYPGLFYSYAITKSESTSAAIKEMINQIKSMQTNLPTEDEMRLAKDGWLNSYVFEFDTKSEIILRMLTYDYFGLPQDYIQQVKKAVEKVTPQDIVEVAKRKLNPESLQILVVGKAEDFDEPLSIFGSVNDIDITIPAPAEDEFAASDEELSRGLELLKKTASACGGVTEFKKINNLTTSSKVTLNMPQGSMTIEVVSVEVYPNKSVQTIKTPMGEQVTVFDGTSGWTSAAGQVQAMKAADLEENKKSADRNIIRLFAHADDPYFKVAYKGEEEWNGINSHRLDFMTDNGTTFTMYINPDDFIPVGSRHTGQTMTGPGEITRIYNEFKKYGNIMQPIKINQKAGSMEMDIEVVNIDINGTYDEGLFKKPEGI
jgi:predicted Zn-dependent peptidase